MLCLSTDWWKDSATSTTLPPDVSTHTQTTTATPEVIPQPDYNLQNVIVDQNDANTRPPPKRNGKQIWKRKKKRYQGIAPKTNKSKQLSPGAIFVIMLISIPTLGCAIYMFIGYCCCKENQKVVNTSYDDEIIVMQPQGNAERCFRIIGLTFSSRPITTPTDEV